MLLQQGQKHGSRRHARSVNRNWLAARETCVREILDQVHELWFVVDLEKHFADALFPEPLRQRTKLGVNRVSQYNITNWLGKLSRLGMGKHRLLNVTPIFERDRRCSQLIENRRNQKRIPVGPANFFSSAPALKTR